MRRLILAALLSSLTVACSSQAGGNASGESAPGENSGDPYRGQTNPLGANAVTPNDLATQIGCGGFQLELTDFPAAWQRGTCQLDGQQLGLNTYTDPTVMELIRQQGGAGAYVSGDGWVVQAPGAEVAEGIRTKLGGDVSA